MARATKPRREWFDTLDAMRKNRYVIRSMRELTDLFDTEGFDVELAEEGGGRGERERDRPTNPRGAIRTGCESSRGGGEFLLRQLCLELLNVGIVRKGRIQFQGNLQLSLGRRRGSGRPKYDRGMQPNVWIERVRLDQLLHDLGSARIVAKKVMYPAKGIEHRNVHGRQRYCALGERQPFRRHLAMDGERECQIVQGDNAVGVDVQHSLVRFEGLVVSARRFVESRFLEERRSESRRGFHRFIEGFARAGQITSQIQSFGSNEQLHRALWNASRRLDRRGEPPFTEQRRQIRPLIDGFLDFCA